MKLKQDEIERIKRSFSINEKEKIIILDEYKIHMKGDKKNFNVYKINENHEITWQIKTQLPLRFENDTFSFFTKTDKNEVCVQTFSGDEFGAYILL